MATNYTTPVGNTGFTNYVGPDGNGFFQWSCNGLNAFASDKRNFTYNGEPYTLYKLQTGMNSTALTAGFK